MAHLDPHACLVTYVEVGLAARKLLRANFLRRMLNATFILPYMHDILQVPKSRCSSSKALAHTRCCCHFCQRCTWATPHVQPNSRFERWSATEAKTDTHEIPPLCYETCHAMGHYRHQILGVISPVYVCRLSGGLKVCVYTYTYVHIHIYMCKYMYS